MIQIKLSQFERRGWLKLSRNDSVAEIAVVYMKSTQASKRGLG